MSRGQDRRGDSVTDSKDSRVLDYTQVFETVQRRSPARQTLEEGELEEDDEILRRRAIESIRSPQPQRSRYGGHLYLSGFTFLPLPSLLNT